MRPECPECGAALISLYPPRVGIWVCCKCRRCYEVVLLSDDPEDRWIRPVGWGLKGMSRVAHFPEPPGSFPHDTEGPDAQRGV